MDNGVQRTIEYGREPTSRRRRVMLSMLFAVSLATFVAWRQYGPQARGWWADVQAWRFVRSGAIANGPFDLSAAFSAGGQGPRGFAIAHDRWTANVRPVYFALQSRQLPAMGSSPGRTPLAICRLSDSSGAERLASVALNASLFDEPEGGRVNVRAIVWLFNVGSFRSPGFASAKTLASPTTTRFAKVGVSEYFDWLSVDVLQFAPGHHLIFETAVIDSVHADTIRVPFVIDGLSDALLIRLEDGDKVSVWRESGRLKDDRSALQPSTTRPV